MHKTRMKRPAFDDDDVQINEEVAPTGEVPSVVYNPYSSYPLQSQREKLPIHSHKAHILYLLESCQVLILTGETGSGKSTQVPQYLHEAGWTQDGLRIGISQPRRVACVTLAKRVAEETGSLVGQVAGYTVRFDDCTSKQTRIKYLTEGILINEIMGDPLLTKYSVIVLDEAHERSLLCDMSLGLLKKILKKRQDLKLIVSSATLDADSIKKFFDSGKAFQTKILSIQGRTYSVDMHYSVQPVPDYVKSAIETVQKIHETQTAGHVLVFLTGEREVDDCCRSLRDYAMEQKHGKMYVCALYASLPSADQLKAFEPISPNVRKVIVATNIAETSVTINGVVYVVDCGFVKIRCYNPKTGTDGLLVVPTSKGSANQRAGRAGRIAPGKAYRLYTEESFGALREFSVPEIQRSNLTWLVLHLKSLGVDNIVRFDFPSAPPSKILLNAVEILYAHGALGEDGQMTDVGKQLVLFNCGPLQAKMLLKSLDYGCSSEMLTIVAMLQMESLFVCPQYKSREAKRARYQFSVSEGDLLTLLNAYTSFVQHQKSKQWCSQHFLSYKSLCKAMEIRSRLKSVLQKISGTETLSSANDSEILRKCIASGYFTNAAYWHYTGEYRSVCGDHTLHVHTESALYSQRPPKFVVFTEVISTHKLFMKGITSIEQEWLVQISPNFFHISTAGYDN